MVDPVFGENMDLAESRAALKGELKRLEDLQFIRSEGVSIAAALIGQIREKAAIEDISVRDMNRAVEVSMKTAVKADEMLWRGEEAERAALAPQRNMVVLILDSPLPDDRKRQMFYTLAAEIGDQGLALIFDELSEARDPEFARELLELEE